MKKILMLLFLSIMMSCYNVERNCEDFHTGTFQFQQIIGDQLQTSRFLRTASLEVEYFNEQVDSASIRWINPCECVLTKLNPTSNQDKRPIAIKIISTSQKEYVFEYSLVGDQKNKQRGTIQKISDELLYP
ncbi:MAG: DNA topoisomerase IV [Flavobacteriaceae bacterium]